MALERIDAARLPVPMADFNDPPPVSAAIRRAAERPQCCIEKIMFHPLKMRFRRKKQISVSVPHFCIF